MTSIAPSGSIDATWTISQTVTRFPVTLPLFSAVGLDTCCGGGHDIAEAARRHELDLDALLQALNAVVAATGVE